MLTKIGLENFKSWQHLDIDLAPITILFGTNSSGKTSILQALLLLKQTVNNFDRKQHINFGGGERDYVDFGSYQDLVYGHNSEHRVGIRIDWNEPLFVSKPKGMGVKEIISLGYEVIWSKTSENIVIDKLSYTSSTDLLFDMPSKVILFRDQNKYQVQLSDGYSNTTPNINNPINNYILPELDMINHNLKPDDKYFAINKTRTQYSSFFEELILKIVYLGPLRQFPERHYQWTGSVPGTIEPDGNHTIQTLIASEKQNNNILQNVEEWLITLGLVDDLKLSTPNDRFYEPKIVIEDMESALVDVGFGVSQVLPVITMLLSAPEGSIILLEQPELHLHPNAQMVLADLMLYVAEKRNLQLIVESHSEHLLRRLQRRIAEVEQDFANPDNIKMYFCEPSKDGSTIKPVEVDEYGQIGNWPANFFGDISGDLDAMTTAALNRRRQELSGD